MPTHSVALHNVEGKLRRHIPPSEADGLVELGHAEWRCLRCSRKTNRGRCIGGKEHQMVLQLKEPERLKRDSAATLTFADAQAVVGITKGEIGAPANTKRVQAARDKFVAWPFVGDNRAVRVGVRP